MTTYESSEMHKNNPTPGAVVDTSITSAGSSSGGGGSSSTRDTSAIINETARIAAERGYTAEQARQYELAKTFGKDESGNTVAYYDNPTQPSPPQTAQSQENIKSANRLLPSINLKLAGKLALTGAETFQSLLKSKGVLETAIGAESKSSGVSGSYGFNPDLSTGLEAFGAYYQGRQAQVTPELAFQYSEGKVQMDMTMMDVSKEFQMKYTMPSFEDYRGMAIRKDVESITGVQGSDLGFFITPKGDGSYVGLLAGSKSSYLSIFERGVKEAQKTGLPTYIGGLGITWSPTIMNYGEGIINETAREIKARGYTAEEGRQFEMAISFPNAKMEPQGFSVEGATVFGGFSSIKGYGVNFLAPGPLASFEPSKSPYGFEAYYKPERGKKSADIFSPRDKYVKAGEGMSISYEEPTPQVAAPSLSVYEDIDARFAERLSRGEGLFAGKMPSKYPNETKSGMIMGSLFMGGLGNNKMIADAVWGGKLALVDYPAVEFTKMGLGFTQATTKGGFALRYGDPRVSPYIGFVQGITGTKATLSIEETKAYGRSSIEGMKQTFYLPVTLAALGVGQRFLTGASVGGTRAIFNAPIIRDVAPFISSSVPFRISAVGFARSAASAPVIFGTLTGVGIASQTGSVAAGIGGAFAVGGSIRGFEMIGERIIASRTSATPEAAYSEGFRSLIERNFVRTKTYNTPEEAARFYMKAEPSDFAAAVKEGNRYSAYMDKGQPRFVSAPVPGMESKFPMVGQYIPATKSAKGFSPLEFKIALAKAQGKEIPSMFIAEPIAGFEFPKGAHLARNPAYVEFMRSNEYLNALKPGKIGKPSFGEWASGKVNYKLNQYYGRVGKTVGFFTQKGVDFVSPKISRFSNRIYSQPNVKAVFEKGEGKLADVLEGAFYARARLGYISGRLSRFEFINPPRAYATRTFPTPIVRAAPSQRASISLQKAWAAQRVSPRSATISSSITRILSRPRTSTRQLKAMEVRSASIYGLKVSPRQSAMQGIKLDTRTNARQSVKQDIRLDLQQSLRQSLRQSTRTSLRTSLRQRIPEQPKIIPKLNLPFPIEKSRERKGKIKFGKPKFGYEPSLTAGIFNIRGRVSSSILSGKQQISGLELRPLVRGGKTRYKMGRFR